MAKDVDLSSPEWTALIFEGKNKEFGAYKLRTASAKRHNIAMLAVVVGVSLIVSETRKAEEDITAENEIETVYDATPDEEEEPEDEPEVFEEPEPEVEEVLPEEILNTQKVTEIAIVNDEEVTDEDKVKEQDEIKDTDTAFGSTDFNEGTDDVTVIREHKDEIVTEEPKAKEPEKVFTAVEEMPSFPGGESALYEFLNKTVRYPEMAQQNNIQGRVVVKFVVEKDGSIGEVVVVRGKDPDLDKEAVRVVKAMPKFIPGKMNGQAVRVWFTLPVTFKLRN